jgi:hypothetical protein
VKTLPKEERPSRKRKKEEYNKKRRERSGEFVKGRSSIYRKILGYYSTIHLPFYPLPMSKFSRNTNKILILRSQESRN